MSSRSPTRPERRRAWAAAAALAAVMLLADAAPASAAVPLPVAGVLSGGGETALVVDLGASDSTAGRLVQVTLDGRPQQADLVPVMSDDLTVSIVVDASTAGAAMLPAWLSAAARFILEAPGSTRAVVIPDRRPATAGEPLHGPSDVVGALTAIRPAGNRDTAAALTLARGQFPRAATGRRLVVMYTSASNAGGALAADLADDFRATGTILVVVGTAEAGEYWSSAATATGGFFSPAGETAGKQAVVPALDQVESTLRDRYLVCFPTPADLPATVAVRVDTGDLTLTGQAVVPAPGNHRSSPALLGPLLVATVLAIVVAIVLLLVARVRRPRPEAGPPGLTTVFRGRAGVPTTARGRAVVPREHGTPWS